MGNKFIWVKWTSSIAQTCRNLDNRIDTRTNWNSSFWRIV